MLVGVADISETAWRKRLRASNAWPLWLLSELVSTAAPAAPLGVRPAGRVLLVDASCLGQPGGTGDDWRLHLAYDFTAGRLGQVQVTDRHGGEHLGRYLWQPGEVLVADRGYGYRRSVALAVRQRCGRHPADPPCHVPAGNGGGEPSEDLCGSGNGVTPPETGTAGALWQGLSVPRPARRRQARSSGGAAGAAPPAPQSPESGAQAHGADARSRRAGLLVITTLEAVTWSTADVLGAIRGALASGTRVQTDETAAAPQPDYQH